MPSDRDRRRRRETVTNLPFDVPATDVRLPGQDALTDVAAGLDAMADGIRPDPETLERALDGLSLPDAGDLAVETSVLSDGIDPAEVDLTLDGDGQVVEASGRAVDAAGETVEVAVDQSGEVATVVFDTGGEAVEVVAAVGGEAVEGSGEVAAEAVVEVVAAALEG